MLFVSAQNEIYHFKCAANENVEKPPMTTKNIYGLICLSIIVAAGLFVVPLGAKILCNLIPPIQHEYYPEIIIKAFITVGIYLCVFIIYLCAIYAALWIGELAIIPKLKRFKK